MDTCRSSKGLPKKGKDVNGVAWSLDGIVRWVGGCGQSWQMVGGWCHGMTSLLSFPVFVCPLPHLYHLPTPSNLICLPSAASAPTPRCTHATMLCLCLD